jgi:ABC-type Zn uptake system ZnuABC Zn-binding protein ZnuA
VNRKKTALIPIVLVLLPLIMSGTIVEVHAQVKPVYNVAVSVGSLAGIAEEIGGSLINTTAILEQESDPHAVQFNTQMLAIADAADLLVFTGHFQWEKDLASQTSTPYVSFHDVNASEDYDNYGAEYSPMPGGIVEEDSPDGNPHAYWLLPKNAIAIANATRVALTTLNATLEDNWNANFASFVEKMENLQLLISDLDSKHDFSQLHAIVVTPAEAYVAEAFGIQCDAVLQVEDITLSGAMLLDVQNALRNGSAQLILGSDIAQFQAGGEFAYQIQSDYGGTLIWWKTIYYASDYFSMMTFNLGALVSGIEGRSGGMANQTTNIALVALSVVMGIIALLEATLLIQKARAE